MFSLSPAENTLVLSGPQYFSRGEHVAFTLSSSVAGPRLIRCHVFGPDGQMIPIYARNLLLNGATAAFTMPSALNDVAGAYTIRATDVVTGATASREITLK